MTRRERLASVRRTRDRHRANAAEDLRLALAAHADGRTATAAFHLARARKAARLAATWGGRLRFYGEAAA